MVTPRVADVLTALEDVTPAALAEPWDHVGLMTGDPAALADDILLSVDPCRAVLDEAAEQGWRCVLSHHPLIFHPLRSVTPTDPAGNRVWRAAQSGLAVIAAHTNFDVAREGVSDALAGVLGLGETVPLEPSSQARLARMVTFVPKGYEEAVLKAAFDAGAGREGRYADCSFRLEGVGTFSPEPGSRPFAGEVGRRTRRREFRVEVRAPLHRAEAVAQAMRAAHPYEEVSLDVFPLENRMPGVGLGRVGRLPQALPAEDLAALARERLGRGAVVTLGGQWGRAVARVAVVGGSGGSYVARAHAAGAECLVTSEISHHHSLDARELGLALIDVDHFSAERVALPALRTRLLEALEKRGFRAAAHLSQREGPVFLPLA